MKIVVNTGYYGPSLMIPSYVLKDFYEKPEYYCDISENITKKFYNGRDRYDFVSRTTTDNELRVNPNLIDYVETEKPIALAIAEIPDEATDWVVTTDRYTDIEEVVYCLDGKLYFA